MSNYILPRSQFDPLPSPPQPCHPDLFASPTSHSSASAHPRLSSTPHKPSSSHRSHRSHTRSNHPTTTQQPTSSSHKPTPMSSSASLHSSWSLASSSASSIRPSSSSRHQPRPSRHSASPHNLLLPSQNPQLSIFAPDALTNHPAPTFQDVSSHHKRHSSVSRHPQRLPPTPAASPDANSHRFPEPHQTTTSSSTLHNHHHSSSTSSNYSHSRTASSGVRAISASIVRGADPKTLPHAAALKSDYSLASSKHSKPPSSKSHHSSYGSNYTHSTPSCAVPETPLSPTVATSLGHHPPPSSYTAENIHPTSSRPRSTSTAAASTRKSHSSYHFQDHASLSSPASSPIPDSSSLSPSPPTLDPSLLAQISMSNPAFASIPQDQQRLLFGLYLQGLYGDFSSWRAVPVHHWHEHFVRHRVEAIALNAESAWRQNRGLSPAVALERFKVLVASYL